MSVNYFLFKKKVTKSRFVQMKRDEIITHAQMPPTLAPQFPCSEFVSTSRNVATARKLNSSVKPSTRLPMISASWYRIKTRNEMSIKVSEIDGDVRRKFQLVR